MGLLERLLAADEAAARTGNVISVLTLQALVHWQLENPEQAMRVLDRLLVLTEPEGYVRVFVDEGAPMQSLLATWLSSPAQQQGSMETRPSAEYVRKLLANFPLTKTHPDRSNEDAGRVETGPRQGRHRDPLRPARPA